MAIGFKGTSISDIEQGAENALEEDIANMSPASNSVASNLNGGIAAVDWSSLTLTYAKTSEFAFPGDTKTQTLISASGYVFDLNVWEPGTPSQLVCDDILIDGNSVSTHLAGGNIRNVGAHERDSTYFDPRTYIKRFDGKIEVKLTHTNADGTTLDPYITGMVAIE